MESNEVRKLTTHIEENLRSSSSSGLAFVDTRNFLYRLCSKQNHVVFGRRGAGKTSLVEACGDSIKFPYCYINLEDYKDITFPNIVIRTLIDMFTLLNKEVTKRYPFYKMVNNSRPIKRRLKIVLSILEVYLHEPDQENQEISIKEAYADKISAGVNSEYLSSGLESKFSKSKEIKRNLPKNKLDFLRIELINYKKLLIDISLLFDNQPLFLILDDFYFVNKDTQPELIDYFHRLTKGSNLFLKVATIKHRSKLYRRKKDQYTGVELPHDILPIDMDYTLNDFEELQVFMRQLLDKAIEGSKAKITFDDIFSGNGFSQLCLASGGVPRDFLSLFVFLSNKFLVNGKTLGKIEVTEAAIQSIGSKMDSMKKDTGSDDIILEEYLSAITALILRDSKKKTNAFLISKDELENDLQLQQAIRELVDLRLIHLINDNTSKAPSDGKRYEAYIIDMGLYENSRPINFVQIEPGNRDEKSRKDDLRSSPILDRQFISSHGKRNVQSSIQKNIDINKQSGQLKLELTSE